MKKASLVKGRWHGVAVTEGLSFRSVSEESLILRKHKAFYAALALLLVAKVTKTAGVAIRPPFGP